MLDSQAAYIVYDGDCPFCSRYVKLLRLRESLGTVHLVNARQPHPAVAYAEEAGVVLDNEMALVLAGKVYSGADCINRLALMSTPSGPLNRLNAALFSSPTASRLAYPVLRACRNATLRALGREPLRAAPPRSGN